MKSTRLVLVAGGVLLSGAALAQLQIVSNLGGTFTDISGSGTALNPTDDSEHNIVTTVGNKIFAAGDVRIGNNGGMGFGVTNGDLGFTNAALPGTGGVSGVFSNATPANPQALLPYWDDLLPGATGNIYWQEMAGTLIVQWNSEEHFSGGGSTANPEASPTCTSTTAAHRVGCSWWGAAAIASRPKPPRSSAAPPSPGCSPRAKPTL